MTFAPKKLLDRVGTRDKDELIAASCAAQYALQRMPDDKLKELGWSREHLQLVVDLMQWTLGQDDVRFGDMVGWAKQYIKMDHDKPLVAMSQDGIKIL